MIYLDLVFNQETLSDTGDFHIMLPRINPSNAKIKAVLVPDLREGPQVNT